jgi:hypothetical protein
LPVPGAVGIRPSQAALRVSAQGVLPDDCQDMRAKPKLNAASASTIRWSFVKAFKTTEECLAHLEKNGFGSVVTSPYMKGCTNGVLHEADCTTYTKLAVWFGNEGAGISPLAIERSEVCSNIPMYGIIEGLNMARLLASCCTKSVSNVVRSRRVSAPGPLRKRVPPVKPHRPMHRTRGGVLRGG